MRAAETRHIAYSAEALICALKPRQVGKRCLPLVHMHAAELGASVQLRKYLAGVEQVLGVESALDPLLLGQVCLVEHFRHEIALLDAHAVFAGQDAADRYTELQDRGAKSFGPLK